MMVTIIKHDLEHPRHGFERRVKVPWASISVADLLKVPRDGPVFGRTVKFVGQVQVDTLEIFSLVMILHHISLVVVSLAQKPAENMSRKGGIIDS